MDLPFDPDKLPTPEQMEEITEAMEGLNLFLKETHQQIIEDKINFLTAGGTTQEFEAAYYARQATTKQVLEKLKSELNSFWEVMEDVEYAVDIYRFERAKIVHEALREASKTDPSLKEIVAKMDAMYEDAMREQEEEDAAEAKGLDG
ncbi:MAG: hypothetical protein IPJ74_24320 [Saprospiraceae bacterium]|nr:hypothetical protein [Saprospiraceae bacterium]